MSGPACKEMVHELVNHSPTNIKPLSLTFGGYKLIEGCTIHGHLRLQSDMNYLKDAYMPAKFVLSQPRALKNYTRLIGPESKVVFEP